jgi:hypothetical protein
MREKLINFETAKLAKEKGFDWPCLCYRQKSAVIGDETILEVMEGEEYYDWNSYSQVPFYSMPNQSLLQKWLRDTHKIDVNLRLNGFGHGFMYSINSIRDCKNLVEVTTLYTNGAVRVVPYEEALEKGLQEGLTLINI